MIQLLVFAMALYTAPMTAVPFTSLGNCEAVATAVNTWARNNHFAVLALCAVTSDEAPK